jgi:hypothetical protein
MGNDISSRIKRIYNLEKWFNKTILLTERYIKTKTYHDLFIIFVLILISISYLTFIILWIILVH